MNDFSDASVDVSNHLSDAQFSGLLLEQGDAATRTHLAACTACRAELERVQESVASFNALGMEWAERRSATLGPVVLPSKARWQMPLMWATAMLVVAGVFAGGMRMERQRRPVMVASNVLPAGVSVPMATEPAQVIEQSTRESAGQSFEQVSEQLAEPALKKKVAAHSAALKSSRIAADNRLLAAISRELNSDESLLVPVSDLRASGRKAQRKLND